MVHSELTRAIELRLGARCADDGCTGSLCELQTCCADAAADGVNQNGVAPLQTCLCEECVVRSDECFWNTAGLIQRERLRHDDAFVFMHDDVFSVCAATGQAHNPITDRAVCHAGPDRL